MNKQIQWQDAMPFNTKYKDIYFSASNGLAEAQHVFLVGNQLEQRWSKLEDNECFCIFEAGFGCGLNFLATLKLWRNIKPNGKLRYISCENSPFSSKQFKRVILPFADELAEEITIFGETTGEIQSGKNDFNIAENIQLTIVNCDIDDALDFCGNDLKFDAIFLDGFSPANNPEMWSDKLCKSLYERCNFPATLATYSVAGVIKRTLIAAGFSIQKVPGHGKKREMLTASKS